MQVARFNHTHTLADVRSFISAARPDITVRLLPTTRPCHVESSLYFSVLMRACKTIHYLMDKLSCALCMCCAKPLLLNIVVHDHSSCLQGAYTLATAFPPKALSDNSITLEAAGLLNAVLIQKC